MTFARRTITAWSFLAAAGVATGIGPLRERAKATVLRERRLHHGSSGTSAEAPTGWGFSTQTGYPAIAFLLLHPDGSKLSISIARTREADGAAFADQNRAALRGSRFRFLRESDGPRKGKIFDLRPDESAQWVRQLYFVRPGNTQTETSAKTFNDGIVVTLVTVDALLPSHEHDLVELAETISFDD